MFGVGAALIGAIPSVVKAVTGSIKNKDERLAIEQQIRLAILEEATKSDLAQAKINTQEAAHKSLFVAGWRPYIGWVCGAAITWAFLLHPIVVWASNLFGVAPPQPLIATDNLMELVAGMLGLAGLRTWEKRVGVARNK